MNKEEILQEARKNNNKNQEFENKIAQKTGLLVVVIIVFLGAIMFALEVFIKKTFDFGLISIVLCSLGSFYFIEGIKVRKLLGIVFGAILLVASLLMFLLFIFQMVV